MEQTLYDNYLRILKAELVPALGCTEPIAIAYAAAKAREILGEMPKHISLICSGNIIKNVKGVTVPNSGGLKGIEAAAILGVVGGNAKAELEVLDSVTAEQVGQTKELIAKRFCEVSLKENVENLYIIAKVSSDAHSASVKIINRHTYITRIEKDGEILYRNEDEEEKDSPDYIDRSLLTVKGILEFADTVKFEDIGETIGRQAEYNSAIADEGIKNRYGAQVGRTILSVYGDRVEFRAMARAAAGSDARMAGCALPVVINSGSGNQGMTVSLPVMEFAREKGTGKEKLYRALVISNLISIHQKYYIGGLSAFCGAVSAAMGAGAAIAYLDGADYETISLTIVNTIANVGGIVCDGAKPSCAAKIASSVNAALLGYYLAKKHRTFLPGEGIVKDTVEETIQSMGYIGRVGMKDTDKEILNIMIDRTKLPVDQ